MKNRVSISDFDVLCANNAVVYTLQSKRLTFLPMNAVNQPYFSKDLPTDGVNIVKVAASPSCNVFACAGNDKSIFLYDIAKGIWSTPFYFHSDTITSLFFYDEYTLISTSSNGCVSVWKRPDLEVHTKVIHQPIEATTKTNSYNPLNRASLDKQQRSFFVSVEDENLPKWARINQENIVFQNPPRPQTRGRWANVSIFIKTFKPNKK